VLQNIFVDSNFMFVSQRFATTSAAISLIFLNLALKCLCLHSSQLFSILLLNQYIFDQINTLFTSPTKLALYAEHTSLQAF